MAQLQVNYKKLQDKDVEHDAGDALYSHQFPSTPRLGVRLASHLAAATIGILLYVSITCQGTTTGERCESMDPLRTSAAGVPIELVSYSERVQFNGTLDFPSIYRGASPEVDKAWEGITYSDLVDTKVTENDIHDLGADPETVAQFPEKDGGGYVVTIEYTHQLHCLNLLRKNTYWNYPHYLADKDKHIDFKSPEDFQKTHVDHCIEMLRQVLMCHADPTPIFEQWVSVRRNPWPNFNTVHQCRDFDAINKWTLANIKQNAEWPFRPDGAKMLELPP